MDLNEDFSCWLSNLLKSLNTDETIFGNYIIGILDSEDSNDEKSEALEEIVSEIVKNETEIKKIINDILNKWTECKAKASTSSKNLTSEEVDVKLSKLLETQTLTKTKQKEYTEDEKKIREAILSQYGQITDDENEETEASAEPKNVEKNLNVEQTIKAEKVKRERAKLESQKKKEKDREDREKQKQLKEEKKEKRKTQKGERKR